MLSVKEINLKFYDIDIDRVSRVSMLKKLLVGVSVLTLLLAGCMSHEYADKIDKAVKLQEKSNKKLLKTIQVMKLNILIKKMPIFMCLTKENMLYWSINHLVMMCKRYYTYEFKDKKHIIIKTLMQKHTTNLMSLDYKEENMY